MNSVVTSLSQVVQKRLHDEWMLYISPRFLTYKPVHEIFIQTQNYTLKTATHLSELVELFRMRHHIFFNETGITDDYNLDLDDFDSLCDHLVIRSNETGEICGTYRMLASTNTKRFYSQNEFCIDHFLDAKGVKLELGRACIHPDHRNGSVIDLLWKGIGEYSRKSKADYLFGCSSIMTMSPVMTKAILKSMRGQGMLSEEFLIRPLVKYRMSLKGVVGEDLFEERFVMSQIPSLLRSYINAGAKVFGKPALDKDFQCIDFFTILNLKELSPSYEKRYFRA
jgi:putative hemolysin